MDRWQEGRTNTVASQLPLLDVCWKGSFWWVTNTQCLINTHREEKENHKYLNGLKGVQLISPSSDEGIAVPGEQGCLRRAHCRDGKAATSHEHWPCFLPWIYTFSCYCSEKQGLLMRLWSTSLSGDASVNTISETASLQTPFPWLVWMANAPAIATYQKPMQAVGLSCVLTFPFISLNLLFRSHLPTCVQMQVFTNKNQLLTRLGLHLSFLWTFLATVLDRKEQDITWFS